MFLAKVIAIIWFALLAPHQSNEKLLEAALEIPDGVHQYAVTRAYHPIQSQPVLIMVIIPKKELGMDSLTAMIRALRRAGNQPEEITNILNSPYNTRKVIDAQEGLVNLVLKEEQAVEAVEEKYLLKMENAGDMEIGMQPLEMPVTEDELYAIIGAGSMSEDAAQIAISRGGPFRIGTVTYTWEPIKKEIGEGRQCNR